MQVFSIYDRLMRERRVLAISTSELEKLKNKNVSIGRNIYTDSDPHLDKSRLIEPCSNISPAFKKRRYLPEAREMAKFIALYTPSGFLRRKRQLANCD